jgi:hypothetical protein
VLVDHLDGAVHRAYGGVSNPAYLIGADGRLAFASLTTGVPALHEAITALLARGGTGVVGDGLDRLPHLLPALTAGWPAIVRGRPGSLADLWRAAPGVPALLWLGARLRPVLAPVALRATPLPHRSLATAGVLCLAACVLEPAVRRPTSGAYTTTRSE